ncbi:MAG TPA: PDZ domain-containing protein [Burkholderiales bacterium]|nr:PDZ domain-containing protein [Burkholderiales bacterium]
MKAALAVSLLALAGCAYGSGPRTDQEVVPGTIRVSVQPSAEGVVVGAVAPGSPASRAGLLPGDVVVSYNGASITSVRQLESLVLESEPGSRARIGIRRAGRAVEVEVPVEEVSTDIEG